MYGLAGKLVNFESLANATNKGFGIELRAEDLVGAIGMDGDAPVADVGDELLMLGGLDLRAEALCVMHGGLAFYVNEDEVKLAGPEHGERFISAAGGLNFKAGELENLVAQRTQHLALADVEDSFLFVRQIKWRRHGVPL